MTKLAAVSREKHGGKYWQRFSCISFAADTSLVPLAARELPEAALNMPVVFAPEKGGYSLTALLSFVPGKNVFVSPEGKWLAS